MSDLLHAERHETLEDADSRLDLELRNKLQLELMKKMIGQEDPPIGDQIEWASKYAKKFSDLMDHHKHDDVRDFAVAGEYDKAVDRLIELFEESK